MATRYKLFSDVKGEKVPSVQKITDDGRKITIPTKNAEGNIDYQEFLQWKADGGVPEEAD